MGSWIPRFFWGDAIWDVISRVLEFIVSTPVTYLQDHFVGVIALLITRLGAHLV